MTGAAPGVLSEIDARGVATLTLARPERHNAFDGALITAMQAALAKLATQRVRLLLLRAQGRSFCAGADLDDMAAMARAPAEQNLQAALALAQLLQSLDEFPAPTVACVQGNAYGGGVGLVACCDLVIAVERAKFALTEVLLGLVPATISPHVVAAIGARHARRYFLTGEAFDAPTAMRLGLVHEVVAEGDFESRIAASATALLAGGPAAQREAKELIREVQSHAPSAALRHSTSHRLARLRASAEGQEGVSAFLEKRAPHWP
jgi:methylglutaconyl-CoA hydratase